MRSPEASPVNWEELLGKVHDDTADSGVSAPGGALVPEADAGPSCPRVRDNPVLPSFIDKFPIPQNVMEELDRELINKTRQMRALFAEEGLGDPFTNPYSGEYFRQDCLDRWILKFIIREKVVVILQTHFGISEENGLYGMLDKILTHPEILLWERDLSFLDNMYRRLYHDETALRYMLDLFRRILAEKFDPPRAGV